MLFCSWKFLVFFLVVFAAYWALPWREERVWLLLAASCFFYASWNHWLALLICVTAVTDYVVALGMERWPAPWKRRVLLALSLAGNLGMLAYFKYANFFLESLAEGLQTLG